MNLDQEKVRTPFNASRFNTLNEFRRLGEVPDEK